MADWSAEQYLKFKEQRTQPAKDLAMRLVEMDPKTVVDLGCGPGNSTAVLQKLFPKAKVMGIDSSPNMIKKAQEAYPEIQFAVCDARNLENRYDVIFSNACLQWIPDHRSLIPNLVTKLNKNGVLAVQIPMNTEEPLFRIIKEVAADPVWNFENVSLETNETLHPEEYFHILSECSSSFDIWETSYYHRMPSHRSLIDWIRGTRLRPYLAVLNEEKALEFENEILKRAEKIYPIESNGEILFRFRRFFFTAVR